jgi:hypothetical protein
MLGSQPFDGIISDEMEDKARQSLAVIDVIEVVEGFPLSKQQPRASQHRHNFGTAEDGDPGEYKVGTDFFARVVWPSNIRILSPRLLQVLRSLVLYYPLFDGQAKEMFVGSPFSIIFHYWDDLQRISDACIRGESSINIKNPETGSEAQIAWTKPLINTSRFYSTHRPL